MYDQECIYTFYTTGKFLFSNFIYKTFYIPCLSSSVYLQYKQM